MSRSHDRKNSVKDRHAPLEFGEEIVEMFCTNCGNKLEASDRFCGQCGTPVNQGPTTVVMTIPMPEAVPGIETIGIDGLSAQIELEREEDDSWGEVSINVHNTSQRDWSFLSLTHAFFDDKGRCVAADWNTETHSSVEAECSSQVEERVCINTKLASVDAVGLRVAVAATAFYQENSECVAQANMADAPLHLPVVLAPIDTLPGIRVISATATPVPTGWDDEDSDSINVNVVAIIQSTSGDQVQRICARTLATESTTGDEVDDDERRETIWPGETCAISLSLSHLSSSALPDLSVSLAVSTYRVAANGSASCELEVVERPADDDGLVDDDIESGSELAGDVVTAHISTVRSDWSRGEHGNEVSYWEHDPPIFGWAGQEPDDDFRVQFDVEICRIDDSLSATITNHAERREFSFESTLDDEESFPAFRAFVAEHLSQLSSNPGMVNDVAWLIFNAGLPSMDEWQEECRAPWIGTIGNGDQLVLDDSADPIGGDLFVDICCYTEVEFEEDDDGRLVPGDYASGDADRDSRFVGLVPGLAKNGEHDAITANQAPVAPANQPTLAGGLNALVDLARGRIKEKKFYFAPNIPAKLANNAINAYANGAIIDQIKVLVDSTTFGSGKDGLLITADAMYASPPGGTPVRHVLEKGLVIEKSGVLLNPSISVNGEAFFSGAGLPKKDVFLLADLLEAVLEALPDN